MVHNHGTEEGPGLACRELQGPLGPIGACVLEAWRQELLDAAFHDIPTQKQNGENYD